ncbi:MAG TPA: alpha-2-macroglobulin family protein [Candidatus Didemnitutus sp.]|jgi:uncharacterized protein YfaS (alpha-2-macroglobulin family)
MRAISRLLLAATLSLAAVIGRAESRSDLWKKVDDARAKELPRTAIEALNTIATDAMHDRAYGEAVRAICERVGFEAGLESDPERERIVRLGRELEKFPLQIRPLLEAILADNYWSFFQTHRWEYAQRSRTAATTGDDIRTWDLPRILTEIDRHFTAALAAEAALEAEPIGNYRDVIESGTVPVAYRPTLYDFLANEALQFYQAGEQAGVVSENDFEITTANPIFDDTDSFLAWKPSGDGASAPEKAIALYQKLLRFHAGDADKSAYFDADLARLAYGFNVAAGDEKDARYDAALARLAEHAQAHEIDSRILALQAQRRLAAGDPSGAHELAARGKAAFPRSAGAVLCSNLLKQIEAPSVEIATESLWNAPFPAINVTHRNVERLYFRVMRVDFEDEIARTRWNLYNVGDDERERLLRAKPVVSWHVSLTPTSEYKERLDSVAPPKDLAPGFYYIAASADPGFSHRDNFLSVAPIWVSDLAIVWRTRWGTGTDPGGLVIRARSGEPVPNAVVRLWRRGTENFASLGSVTTNADGIFPVPAGYGQLIALAESDGQAVAIEGQAFDPPAADVPSAHVVILTDRALYRPGQAIDYKGIALVADHGGGKYSVTSGAKVTVVFRDANEQEIARADHTTNDYGSFAGTFTAPSDRLAGMMSIGVLGRAVGDNAVVRVEEYKRPKFRVELDAPTDAPKLGATVSLHGHATAYTGAPVDTAKVKWRVERVPRLPPWCWWWRPEAPKAVAHGTAMAAVDGSFTVSFVADSDRKVPEKLEPVFQYVVHADVTDTAGETRTAQREIRVGYTALQASIEAGEWQTPDVPVNLTIRTRSLDEEPAPAQGRVRVQSLRQPERVERAALVERTWSWLGEAAEPKSDPSNPDTWEPGDVVVERDFRTGEKGDATVAASLKVGIYRATVETADRFGHRVTARRTIRVVDPAAAHFAEKTPYFFEAKSGKIQPGETFTALWGTGYDQGRALVEIECAGRTLATTWTPTGATQHPVTMPVTEAMRGGFTVRVTFVHDNRSYSSSQMIDVPWSNQELSVRWESFRSKLTPGEKETWTAVIIGPNAKRTAAEMAAVLYDASLDQFVPHGWSEGFGVFRQESGTTISTFQNRTLGFEGLGWWRGPDWEAFRWTYPSFRSEIGTGGDIARGGNGDEIVLSPFVVSAGLDKGYTARQTLAGTRLRTTLVDVSSALSVASHQFLADVSAGGSAGLLQYSAGKEVGGVQGDFRADRLLPASDIDLGHVTARKNLNETAFFFPQLLTGDDGMVRMTFTVPEALTEWRFLGFAHDKDLRAGLLTDKAVTSKDLMVQPNPPRFVREGDEVEFTVKVTNRTDADQSGKMRLTFADASSLASVDDALGNRAAEQIFTVPAKQSRTYSWRIAVPDGLGFLTYKAVAATTRVSDGEEGYLPVLSRRVLVTESLPLPLRGAGTEEFDFKKLLESGSSTTLRQESLTVQMTSHPAWYAVMALPYLMEFPHECSEQVFERLYANALARHIADSDPKIARVFEQWKNTPALESPLEKNRELKSVALEETPWVREAQSETTARHHVGLLFERNRTDAELARAMQTLRDRQLSDGQWSWFPGGPASEFITWYVVAGFGRLNHLGVKVDESLAFKALGAIDAARNRRYRDIQRGPHPEDYVPGYDDALDLYGRSFFAVDHPVKAADRVALDFFLAQARKNWATAGGRMTEAQLALALLRFGDHETPAAILKSLKERSVTDPELGRFWNDEGSTWWWWHAPIETQAMMIEAFDEIGHDAAAVEECKVWLMKQKQTQDWQTTKATADAVYALLLRGDNLISSDALVQVSLGGRTIAPEKVETGTGFYEQKFVRDQIVPAMGHITVAKSDAGVSWGSVHWQYLEDIAKITPHEATALQLKKSLFVRETTAQGPVLKPVNGPLAVGDEVVVRLELRTDRDLEFVHLKDQRGSGTEPVNVLSGYRYQDGLVYYESTHDTATHFFIESLPKGVHVFEYPLRVQLKGRYQAGLAEIQCMYAPEFNAHSESIPLEVR